MDEIDFKEKFWCNSNFLLGGIFVFYGMAYYGMLKVYWDCDKLPPFGYVFMLLLLHLAQAYFVLYFHSLEQKAYALAIGFVPIILLFGFLRYQKNMQVLHEAKLKKILYEQKKKQKQKESSQLAQLDQPIQMGPDTYFSQDPMLQHQNMYMQQQPASVMNSNTVPAYGDYVSQFDQSKTMGFGTSCTMGNF